MIMEKKKYNLEINSNKSTVWHTVADAPSNKSEIVIMDINEDVYNYLFTSTGNWEQLVEDLDIVIWAYLDDLLNL